ncbi:MAG: hypothetical protein NVS3B21_15000 [Acidimicrobiales bacterium]
MATTFVFTDIEDSTGRAERLGDAAWSELLRRHHDLVAEIVAAYGGKEVKRMGDGAMLVFTDVGAAVACADELRLRLASIALPIRVGVHYGDAIAEGEDYIGLQVHIAARIGAAAVGGEVLVSAATRQQLGPHTAISFGPPRTVQLRGLTGMHRVYPIGVFGPSKGRPDLPFVGRTDELRELSSALGGVLDRGLTSVLITGEAGAGKSRLVSEVCRAASCQGRRCSGGVVGIGQDRRHTAHG